MLMSQEYMLKRRKSYLLLNYDVILGTYDTSIVPSNTLQIDEVLTREMLRFVIARIFIEGFRSKYID